MNWRLLLLIFSFSCSGVNSDQVKEQVTQEIIGDKIADTVETKNEELVDYFQYYNYAIHHGLLYIDGRPNYLEKEYLDKGFVEINGYELCSRYVENKGRFLKDVHDYEMGDTSDYKIIDHVYELQWWVCDSSFFKRLDGELISAEIHTPKMKIRDSIRISMTKRDFFAQHMTLVNLEKYINVSDTVYVEDGAGDYNEAFIFKDDSLRLYEIMEIPQFTKAEFKCGDTITLDSAFSLERLQNIKHDFIK